MDWSAAVWAGLIAGAVFLLFLAFVAPLFSPMNGWVYLRLIASIPLGETVLAPPATYDLQVLLAAIVTQLLLSVSFAMVNAFVLHRWGMIVGILGGGALGVALYVINFWTVSYFFPWFFPMRGFEVFLGHVVFGALAGGIYEALEVEEFEDEDEDSAGAGTVAGSGSRGPHGPGAPSGPLGGGSGGRDLGVTS